MTKEDAQKEVNFLIDAYKKEYPMGRSGFLQDSSLVGNEEGDSARYWKLQEIIDGTKKNEVIKKIFRTKVDEMNMKKDDRMKKFLLEHKKFSFENTKKKYLNSPPYFVGEKEGQLWSLLKSKGVDWFKINHKAIYKKWQKFIKKR